MRPEHLIAIVLAGSLLGACGPGSARPAHQATTLRLDQSFDGRSVQARVGDQVELSLVESRPVPGSSLTWRAVSSDPNVLAKLSERREPHDARPVGQDSYVAQFGARHAGTARIEARGATTCEAMAKSSCPDHSFSSTVEVR